jgi:hypothetical protein
LQEATQVITVYSGIRNDRSEEAEQIELDDHTFRDLVRRQYRNLEDTFQFDFCNIRIFSDRFQFILGVERGTVNVDTRDLFNHYLDVSHGYVDMNELFSIEDTINVNDHEINFYTNEARDDVIDQSLYVTTYGANGYYLVDGAHIYFTNIDVNVPRFHRQNNEANIVVNYVGYIDVDNGQGVDTPDTRGMDHHVRVTLGTTNDEISGHFSNSHPEFHWSVEPTTEQVNVNLLITLLDLDNSIDPTIAPFIGENAHTDFDSNIRIVPPNGLSSINNLAINSATFTSVAGSFQDLVMNVRVPDFDFLPLDIASSNNECIIHYTNSAHNRVYISGTTYLGDGLYSSEFVKDYDKNTYRITLYGAADTQLSFATIGDVFFPTISLRADRVLTSDQRGLDMLASFGITERGTVVRNVIVTIEFTPFLMYTVSGGVNSLDSERSPIALFANFVNLDGSVLSYVDFGFTRFGPRDALMQSFGVTGGDAGFQSLHINRFGLVSINRDFNTNKVSELRNQNVIAFRDSNVMLKNSLSAYLDTRLIEDCIDNTLCILFKENEVPGHFNFTGLIEEMTNLTAPVYEFELNSAVRYNDTIFQLSIVGGEPIHAHINGNFITLAQPDRELLLDSTWTFGNTPAGDIQLSGTKNDIFDDVFGLTRLDLIQAHITGQILSNGTIVGFGLSGTGLLGRDCYTREELISELQSENDPTEVRIVNFFDNANTAVAGAHIAVIDPSCRQGNVYITIVTEDLHRSYLTANFAFSDLEDFMRALFTPAVQDTMPHLTNIITFPVGLTATTNFRTVHRRGVTVFQGTMDFLGVSSIGRIAVDLEVDNANMILYMPQVSIGGGACQFISAGDLSRLYGVDRHHQDSQNFHFAVDFDEIERVNTITAALNPSSLHTTRLDVDATVLLLGMVSRVRQPLTQDNIIFTVHGHPFNGAFGAESTVQVVPVPDISRENNSILRMILHRERAYLDLESSVNELFQDWMTRILRTALQADNLINQIGAQINFLTARYIPDSECRVENYCQETPTLICARYAQEAVCAEEQQV